MNITLNRCELLAAARAAEKIAPAKSMIAALECVCLNAGDGSVTITATNLEITLEQRIPADVQEPGRMLVPAKWLASMLNVLPGDRVTLRHDNAGRVHIPSGKAEFTLAAPAVEDFPQTEIPFPEDTVLVSCIPALVKRTAFAVSNDNAKPVMNCVNLVFRNDSLYAFGSDGCRLAVAKGSCKGAANTSLLVPAVSLHKLAQLVNSRASLRVGVAGKNVVFSRENFLFSARLMDGRYPDADQVLSRLQRRFTVLTDSEQLRKALASVAAVTGTRDKLSLAFQEDRIQICFESEHGVSAIELPVTALSGTPDGVFWYSPTSLKECLRALDGTLMIDVAQQGMLQFKTDNLTCVQTAIREPKSLAEPARKKQAA